MNGYQHLTAADEIFVELYVAYQVGRMDAASAALLAEWPSYGDHVAMWQDRLRAYPQHVNRSESEIRHVVRLMRQARNGGAR